MFIDLGVNWGNTARLFKNIDPLASEPYHVYGFEASPLIQPFAEEYFAWLAGTRVDEPESCLPRSGSSAHLNMYAPYYGCPAVVPGMANTSVKMLTCKAKDLFAKDQSSHHGRTKVAKVGPPSPGEGQIC